MLIWIREKGTLSVRHFWSREKWWVVALIKIISTRWGCTAFGESSRDAVWDVELDVGFGMWDLGSGMWNWPQKEEFYIPIGWPRNPNENNQFHQFSHFHSFFRIWERLTNMKDFRPFKADNAQHLIFLFWFPLLVCIPLPPSQKKMLSNSTPEPATQYAQLSMGQFLKWRPVNKLDQTLLGKCMYTVHLLLYFAFIQEMCWLDIVVASNISCALRGPLLLCTGVREREGKKVKVNAETELAESSPTEMSLGHLDKSLCFFLPSECFLAYWLTDVNDKLGYDARPLTPGLDNVHVPLANGEILSYLKIFLEIWAFCHVRNSP